MHPKNDHKFCAIGFVNEADTLESRGCIFSCVQPFYERAVSDLDP